MHQGRVPSLVSVAPSGSPLLLYVGVCWIPLLAPQTLQTSPSSSLPNPPSQPFRIEQTITSLWKSQQDLTPYYGDRRNIRKGRWVFQVGGVSSVPSGGSGRCWSYVPTRFVRTARAGDPGRTYAARSEAFSTLPPPQRVQPCV